MTEYFTDQLDVMRELNYESCPGEENCEMTGPIFFARRSYPDLPVMEVCDRCEFLPTKAGQEPRHLIEPIRIAGELMESKAVCEGFSFPAILEHLTAYEWTCITALQLGQRESEMNGMRERQKESKAQSDTVRLEAMRRR